MYYSVRVLGVFKIEPDLNFQAKYQISIYAEDSHQPQYITEVEQILRRLIN